MMTLSAPAPRRLSHKRTITLDGFAREDGHYDIEAELMDVKNYDFPNQARGEIKKDEPLHHMKVRVTISEEMAIINAEAVTLAGPYFECPHGADNIRHLIGLKIQPGWKKIVARAIGGREGCTHITELMGPVATVAFQTIYAEKAKRKREALQKDPSHKDDENSMAIASSLLNSCYALAEGREAARQHQPSSADDSDNKKPIK